MYETPLWLNSSLCEPQRFLHMVESLIAGWQKKGSGSLRAKIMAAGLRGYKNSRWFVLFSKPWVVDTKITLKFPGGGEVNARPPGSWATSEGWWLEVSSLRTDPKWLVGKVGEGLRHHIRTWFFSCVFF